MISVLREGKGHDLAVAAVEELAAELPGIRLLIAGDGPAHNGSRASRRASEGRPCSPGTATT